MEKKIAFDWSELKNIEATYADGLSYNPFYSIEDAFKCHVPKDATITVTWLPLVGGGKWGRSDDGSEWRIDEEGFEVTLSHLGDTQVYFVTEHKATHIYKHNNDPDDTQETTDIRIQGIEGKLS